MKLPSHPISWTRANVCWLFLLVFEGFVISADITIIIRIFTGGSLDSISFIILSNVSLAWNPFGGVDLGFSTVELATLWITWYFLVWVFSFSNLSVVKEHFLQLNFSLFISFNFQTTKENRCVQFYIGKYTRIRACANQLMSQALLTSHSRATTHESLTSRSRTTHESPTSHYSRITHEPLLMSHSRVTHKPRVSHESLRSHYSRVTHESLTAHESHRHYSRVTYD